MLSARFFGIGDDDDDDGTDMSAIAARAARMHRDGLLSTSGCMLKGDVDSFGEIVPSPAAWHPPITDPRTRGSKSVGSVDTERRPVDPVP